MARESAATKATRYLAEGRLIVRAVGRGNVEATCRGDGAVYHVGWHGARWSCTCPARGRCAHLIALGRVVSVEVP